jgi:hypothetical protein
LIAGNRFLPRIAGINTDFLNSLRELVIATEARKHGKMKNWNIDPIILCFRAFPTSRDNPLLRSSNLFCIHLCKFVQSVANNFSPQVKTNNIKIISW